MSKWGCLFPYYMTSKGAAIRLRVEGCNQIHFEYKQCVHTVAMMQIYSVLRFKHRILHPWFFGVLMWVVLNDLTMRWSHWTEGRWEEVPKRTGETYFRSHSRIEEIHKHPISNVIYCHHQAFFVLAQETKNTSAVKIEKQCQMSCN